MATQQRNNKRQLSTDCSHTSKKIKSDISHIEWPAPSESIDAARQFIKTVVSSRQKVLLAPDKDADGLSAGAILYRTLTTLGLPEDLISVHLLQKGSNIHQDTEMERMQIHNPRYVIVLDQGSKGGRPILSGTKEQPVDTLIIDHHYSFNFPEEALVCSAAHSPPVATSALLSYHICVDLHNDLKDKIAYLGVLGTVGDLGASVKWSDPFPEALGLVMKAMGKKNVSDAVGLVNAPRRSSIYNVEVAWKSILDTNSPSEILNKNSQISALMRARDEVAAEVERCTHTPPLFSADKRFACLTISSPCQVHPVIATRWAGFLKSKDLLAVCVANRGYMPGRVHFSCRIPKNRRDDAGTEREVNIINLLKEYAALDPELEPKLLKDSFANGHKEASGGALPVDLWDALYKTMQIGEAVKAKKEAKIQKQTNTLMNYFASPGKKAKD